MMFPHAAKGCMPFAPDYQKMRLQVKAKHERLRREAQLRKEREKHIGLKSAHVPISGGLYSEPALHIVDPVSIKDLHSLPVLNEEGETKKKGFFATFANLFRRKSDKQTGHKHDKRTTKSKKSHVVYISATSSTSADAKNHRTSVVKTSNGTKVYIEDNHSSPVNIPRSILVVSSSQQQSPSTNAVTSTSVSSSMRKALRFEEIPTIPEEDEDDAQVPSSPNAQNVVILSADECIGSDSEPSDICLSPNDCASPEDASSLEDEKATYPCGEQSMDDIGLPLNCDSFSAPVVVPGSSLRSNTSSEFSKQDPHDSGVVLPEFDADDVLIERSVHKS